MRRSRASHYFLLIVIAWVSCAALRADDPPPLEIDEPPAIFHPKHPRTELEEDRLTAVSRYAEGRMQLRHGNRSAALRLFQRAWRYDPNTTSIAAEVVFWAGELERREEAATYAILAAERRPSDPDLMRKLGALLIQRNELPRAVRLFEVVMELEKDAPSTTNTVSLRLELGRLYFILGEFAKAADQFDDARGALISPGKYGLTKTQRDRLLSKAPLLYTIMGESYLLADRPDDAIAAFQRANQATPDAPLLGFQQARVHARKKEWKRARAHLEIYLDANASTAGDPPYDLLYEILAATASDETTAKKELVEMLSAFHRRDPTNTPLCLFLGNQLLETEQWDDAERVFLASLKVRSTPNAYQGLCRVYRQRHKPSEILGLLELVVRKNGNLEAIGRQRQQLAHDAALFAQLLQLTDEGLKEEAQPKHPERLLGMALLAVTAEDPDTAERLVRAATRASGKPQPDYWETVGLSMLLAGQCAHAAGTLERAIEETQAPLRKAGLDYYRAGALEMAGRTDEAIRAARNAIGLQPDSALMQIRIPWILYHAKRYADAETEYLHFLDEYDTFFDSNRVRRALREARIMLSNICVLQERLPEAEEWLEQVLDEFPEDVSAFNDLGYLWVDQGTHLRRALRMIQHAVDSEPDNTAYRDSLGWAFYRLGQYDRAVQELEKATSEEPPDGVILDHLGDAYREANQPDKAIATWRRAAVIFHEQQDTKSLAAIELKLRRYKED